ncbi:MAG TPA: SAP domain-containing protein [Dehalococcoidia bacterium]|nr:SAP domain-containing protein [Dehalococcoidia bacterium]
MSEIDDFLKNFGAPDKAEEDQWDKVIQPKASYLLTGDVGTGKSALAYFIMERYSEKYGLTPSVVGLPKNKRTLLPDNFKFLDDIMEIASNENAIVFIDEADIQLPLDSNKDKEAVINFLSLPRQRKQIFILAYHFPRLVKGTYLPFFRAFLFKRPPYLLEFASKKSADVIMGMMSRAGERFDEMPSEDEVLKNTYIVAPRIRWQGLLQNGLPSFWSQDLSEIWSGVGVDYSSSIEEKAKQLELSPERLREEMKAQGLEDPYWHNVSELQALCHERGLPTTGNKDDLVLRLFGLN